MKTSNQIYHVTEEINGEIVREEFYFDIEDATGAVFRISNHTWYRAAEKRIVPFGIKAEKAVSRMTTCLTGKSMELKELERREISYRAVEVK